MYQRQLGYESLKIIIEYLDTNKRIQLSIHCPKIRRIEKSISLHINKLEFGIGSTKTPLFVAINSTKYTVGIHRDYPTDQIPNPHRKENSQGGVGCDLDEFGFPDYSTDKILMEGDVAVGNVQNRQHHYLCEFEVIVEEKRIANARSRNETEDLDVMEADLQPYLNRRDRLPRGYNTSAMITIQSNEVVSYSRQYDLKIHEAHKLLTTFLFGSRKSTNVKELHINYMNSIIRLPAGLRLKVQEAYTPNVMNQLCEAIDCFLCPSSFPLKKVSSIFMPRDIHRHAREAEEISVHCFMGMINKLELMLSLTNRKIEMKYGKHVEGGIIENLIENYREVGTTFSFGYTMNAAKRNFEELKRRFNGRENGRGSFIVPTNYGLGLQVSYSGKLRDALLSIQVVNVQ